MAGFEHGKPSVWKAVLTVVAPAANLTDEELKDHVSLEVCDGRGSWVMRVRGDGRMDFNPIFKPSEQAKAFQQAINITVQQAMFPLAVAREG